MKTAEKEIAEWLKTIRKQTWNLTQKELAELAGVPIGTLRFFEQTGKTSLTNFLKIAKALHVEDSLLAIPRGEEPLTVQKIQREKTISRLRDEISLLKGETTPMKLREKNARVKIKPTRWRLKGREKWMEATNQTDE